jgi:Ca2+-binding RTX toxin-like protein
MNRARKGRMTGRLLTVVFAAMALMLAVPTASQAAVSCSFATGTMQVTVTGGGSQAVSFIRGTGGASNSVIVKSGSISSGTPVSCDDPATSTVATINVDDTTTGQATTVNISLVNGAFEPGAGAAEAGTSEIEFDLDLGDGNDILAVTGRADPADDDFRLGALPGGESGINLNAPEASSPDSDISLSSSGIQPDSIRVSGEADQFDTGPSGDNRIASVTGAGEGFTGPLPTFVNFFGGDGDDVLVNGDGGGLLNGGGGNDTLIGGDGNDDLTMGPGNDSADGNAGTDTANLFASGGTPAVLDLRITGPQDTGHGIKTISDAENATGDRGSSDTIIGTDGPNQLSGGDVVSINAPDTLIGLGGDDVLVDRFSTGDTVSFAQGSTGPVTFDLGLTTTQATGGAGSDRIVAPPPTDPTGEPFEKVIGGPFSDTLTGTAEGNEIDPGLGSDDVFALAGDDLIDAGDNVAEEVDCGDDSDIITADEDADTLTGCEIVTLVNPPPPPPPPPVKDTRAPETSLDKVPRAKVRKRSVTYGFSADEAGATFSCKVDKGPARPCTSPLKLSRLKKGRHRLAVAATAGNADASPATDSFRVVKKKHRRR